VGQDPQQAFLSHVCKQSAWSQQESVASDRENMVKSGIGHGPNTHMGELLSRREAPQLLSVEYTGPRRTRLKQEEIIVAKHGA
jgi:hypothetical protein